MKALTFLGPTALALSSLLAACGGDNAGRVATTPAPRTTADAATPQAVPSTPATAAAAPSPAGPAPVPTRSGMSAGPTTAPPAPPAPPSPAPTSAPASSPMHSTQYLTIAAKDVRFTPTKLDARTGSPVAVTFDNEDAGVNHDLLIYSPAGGIVAQSDVSAGPSETSIGFMPSAAGNYAFKCSLHPQSMYGAIAISP